MKFPPFMQYENPLNVHNSPQIILIVIHMDLVHTLWYYVFKHCFNCVKYIVTEFLQEMSHLLGNHEYDLTLSWQNFTVKVKRRSVLNNSTGAWLRSFIRCKNSEEITILNNGELKEKSLLINVWLSNFGSCNRVGNPAANHETDWWNVPSFSRLYCTIEFMSLNNLRSNQ